MLSPGKSRLFISVLRIITLLLLTVTLRAEWPAQELVVDGTPVKLVFPAEYVKAPDDDPGLDNSRKLMPDFMIFANYKTETPFKFVQVQMHQRARSYRYTKDSFVELVQSTKAQLPNFDTKEVKAVFDQRLESLTNGALKLAKPVVLPLAAESDRHIIVPVLMGMTVEQPSPRQITLVCATITIALNSRLLFLQVYLPYKDKTTVAQATELAGEIARQTLAANK